MRRASMYPSTRTARSAAGMAARRPAAQGPPAEPDDPAAPIANGEHDAPAKAIVHAAIVAATQQTGPHDHLARYLALAQPCRQPRSARRGEADSVPLDRGLLRAPVCEVAARGFPGIAPQDFLEKARPL